MNELEKGFLLKLNTEQFRKLFPERSNKFMSEDISGDLVIVDITPIPEDCIACDYSCNKNLVDEDYFYLLMLDLELIQGTVCEDCYNKSWKEDNYTIKDFEEIFGG